MFSESTRVCIHCLDFQYNIFLYVFFIVKKQPLYMNFNIPPCGRWFFSQCSTPLVDMRFWGHVPTHLETRIWRGSFHIYFKKWFFLGLQNSVVLVGRREKHFFVNFERCDLANGEEWVCKIWRTRRHRISYEILRLYVPKETSILYNLSMFWGCFDRKKHP
jgi:hypothetical protein